MTNEQALLEARKAVEADSRLAELFKQAAKYMADQELRRLYCTNEAAALIRGAGIAEGIEKFVSHITKTR